MNIKKILLDALKETFLHLNYSIDDITLTFSAKEGSDFQCNSAFALAKKAQTSPEVVANAISDAVANKKAAKAKDKVIILRRFAEKFLHICCYMVILI